MHHTRDIPIFRSSIVALIQVTVRHAKSKPSPSVTYLKLAHNHVVNYEAVGVKLRLARKLSSEQREQIDNMTCEISGPLDEGCNSSAINGISTSVGFHP